MLHTNTITTHRKEGGMLPRRVGPEPGVLEKKERTRGRPLQVGQGMEPLIAGLSEPGP